MNQDTQNKMAAIIAAAQAKTAQSNQTFAAKQETKKEEVKPVFKPEVKDIFPEIAAQESSDNTVELSALTFDDLMNVRESVNCSPITLIDYSERAFAIVGETKPIKEQLKALGGRFNMFLTCGAGWIFSKTKIDTVKKALAL